MQSSTTCIEASTPSSMLASLDSPSFLVFLFLFCFCHLTDVRRCASSLTFLSSGPFVRVFPHVHFKNCPSFLQGGKLKSLSLWRDSCCRARFPEVFSFFFKFYFISAYLMVFVSNIPQYLLVFFSPNVLIFSWFSSSIFSVICLFPQFIIRIAHFSMLNSIPISWLSNIVSYISNFFLFFFFFWKQLDVVHVYKVIDIFCGFL